AGAGGALAGWSVMAVPGRGGESGPDGGGSGHSRRPPGAHAAAAREKGGIQAGRRWPPGRQVGVSPDVVTVRGLGKPAASMETARDMGGAGMERLGRLPALAGLFVAALACTALPGEAVGGTIYRCERGDGVTSYVSKRVSGARCSVATTYRPARPSRPSQPATTPGAPAAGSGASAGAPATFMGGGSTPAAATVQVPSAPSSTSGSRRLVQG